MRQTYRIENDEIIKGVSLPIFIHNLQYHLTNLHVFEDGMIDCWGLVDFDGFKEKVESGWIKTSIPEGENIYAFPLGRIETTVFHPNRDENELVKEVQEILDKFQGKKTASDSCLEAFEAFKKHPTETNRQALERTYDLVAKHNRRFLLGDMDVDDLPIQISVYGDKIFDESTKARIQEKLIREHYLKGIAIRKTTTAKK